MFIVRVENGLFTGDLTMKLLWPFFIAMLIVGVLGFLIYFIFVDGAPANSSSPKDDVIAKIVRLDLSDLAEVHQALHENIRLAIKYEQDAATAAARRVERATKMLEAENLQKKSD